ncbi:cytochrome c [uncultured Tenacibaculum sp.]|uniref:c-type cytochrome n=1 Tax=uncultured Tenacibaculum sp. TaxID=174713 RepID=UPI00262DFCA0|nr:cytochrome c [uncultured Tenacibaculum sp.]
MKLSENIILGSIISVILVLMIAWVVQIETAIDDSDVDNFTSKKEKIVRLSNSLKQSKEKGKKLWRENNCTNCHKIHTHDGHPLPGVKDRYPKEWLIQYVKNEQVLIEQKDPDVLALNAEWNSNKSEHKNPHLTEQDILDILNYINRK